MSVEKGETAGLRWTEDERQTTETAISMQHQDDSLTNNNQKPNVRTRHSYWQPPPTPLRHCCYRTKNQPVYRTDRGWMRVCKILRHKNIVRPGHCPHNSAVRNTMGQPPSLWYTSGDKFGCCRFLRSSGLANRDCRSDCCRCNIPSTWA